MKKGKNIKNIHIHGNIYNVRGDNILQCTNQPSQSIISNNDDEEGEATNENSVRNTYQSIESGEYIEPMERIQNRYIHSLGSLTMSQTDFTTLYLCTRSRGNLHQSMSIGINSSTHLPAIDEKHHETNCDQDDENNLSQVEMIANGTTTLDAPTLDTDFTTTENDPESSCPYSLNDSSSTLCSNSHQYESCTSI